MLQHVLTAKTTFAEGLDQFLIVYIDDILVYSPTEDQYKRDLWWTFERLCYNKLYAKRKKYEFTKQEVEYLGHIVKAGYVFVDPTKTEAVWFSV